MRYIVNSNNYVVAVSFGSRFVYNDCECTEYSGVVPSGWSSLEDWHTDEGEKLWRWKIVNGNLTLDSKAKAPPEGRWGVPNLQSKKVSSSATEQTITPDEDYDGLSQVVIEAMSVGKLAEPRVEISDQGVITAYSAINKAGYLSNDAFEDGKFVMGTQGSAEVTPGTERILAVGAKKYTTGNVYVKGDSDLTAANIKKGVSIFGVPGEYTGEDVSIEHLGEIYAISRTTIKIPNTRNYSEDEINAIVLIGKGIYVDNSDQDGYILSLVHKYSGNTITQRIGVSYAYSSASSFVSCALTAEGTIVYTIEDSDFQTGDDIQFSLDMPYNVYIMAKPRSI